MKIESDYVCSFDELQQSFVAGAITLEQFVEVLIDNFGMKNTRRIIKKNLKLALKKERKSKSKE